MSAPAETPRLKVAVTGAAGRIGRVLCPLLRPHYDLRTLDRVPVAHDPKALLGDVRDLDFMRKALAGADVLVHLAAEPYPFANWTEELVEPNIIGAQRAFQAAQEAGVRRIVYASSCHSVLGYPWDQTVPVTATPKPRTLYGVSKQFGEILGRYYHDKHGVEFVAVRIGAFSEKGARHLRKPGECRMLWLSPDDGAFIFRSAIEQPGIGYEIVHATSRTEPEFLALEHTRELFGYEPADDVRNQ
ncbi:MAG: NAD(P)-dependent oxidoreductase [Planctomycetota bacterium]|nr:NAD(P)-dependent oxidoreductase [Planctomycetota bacterium]